MNPRKREATTPKSVKLPPRIFLKAHTWTESICASDAHFSKICSHLSIFQIKKFLRRKSRRAGAAPSEAPEKIESIRL